MWPDELRCPISLGFDVDGASSAINKNPDARKFPSLISMREYGPKVAVPRILNLLEKHEIKATFFIPGYIAETNNNMVLSISDSGHEIAHHGYMHEPPSTLTPSEEEEVLDKGAKIIREITGVSPLGYRSPSWELSPQSLKLLSEKGFEYDSSLMGDDIPYFVKVGARKLVEIPIHWELDDHPFFNYSPALNQTNVAASPEHVYQVWSSAFEGLHFYNRSFVLTMHPYIIGRPGRLLMLDKLIEYIKSFKGIQFFTALELSRLYKGNNGH